jgi:hypothetical protein
MRRRIMTPRLQLKGHPILQIGCQIKMKGAYHGGRSLHSFPAINSPIDKIEEKFPHRCWRNRSRLVRFGMMLDGTTLIASGSLVASFARKLDLPDSLNALTSWLPISMVVELIDPLFLDKHLSGDAFFAGCWQQVFSNKRCGNKLFVFDHRVCYSLDILVLEPQCDWRAANQIFPPGYVAENGYLAVFFGIADRRNVGSATLAPGKGNQ